MDVKNGNGKRERTDHEDDQEFMPLSKRINNIHLSPERALINGHARLQQPGPSLSHLNGHHRVPDIIAQNSNLGLVPTTSAVAAAQFHNNLSVTQVPVDVSRSEPNSFVNAEYRPSLNRNDNPHYYEQNRALFDLYLERMSRHNNTPHPSVFIGNASTLN